jgi:hypothetical protein
LDPKGNSIQVSIKPFETTWNEDQQEQIKVWLEQHKRSENSDRCFLDLNSKEKIQNMQ